MVMFADINQPLATSSFPQFKMVVILWLKFDLLHISLLGPLELGGSINKKLDSMVASTIKLSQGLEFGIEPFVGVVGSSLEELSIRCIKLG